MPESYPALTVRNPWAWAIAHAGKSVENRTWEMTHKGPLWLHAGCRSRWDPAGADSPLVQEAWLRETGIPDVLHGTARDIGLHRNSDRIPFGAITALLEVTGCHFWDECGQGQKANGRWSWTMCSPWAVRGQWHIGDRIIRVLPEPVPCRGMLGLWPLPGDAEKQACRQLEADHNGR